MGSAALFSKTPPLKLFFLASIPGAISMLASALYQMLDGIFVGQFLGATAFAAVNLAMPFVIINFSLADLIGVGSSVPISISLGKKQEEEAPQLALVPSAEREIMDRLRELDVNTLTPIECMTQLFELTTLAKKDT